MTPAKITHVGAPGAAPQPPADSLGTTTSPRLAVLWNGKPLADLGLHEHVIDAEFVTTVGRTKATTRQPTGKPKVGGARLTFHMADSESAAALMRLLMADKQPIITLGFGYHDSAAFWTGQVQAARKPDPKSFGRVHGFKMDTITQSNDGGVQKLTINGMVDRAMSLCEQTKPRVLEDLTARQIMGILAHEHGLELIVDDDVFADQRMSHVIKASGENDLTLFTRVVEKIGAHPILRTATTGEVGAADFYGYKTDGPGLDPDDVRGKLRTVMHVVSLASFYDATRIEATRPIVIGYGPGCDSGRAGNCDYLAQSIQVSASHFNAKKAVSSAVKASGALAKASSPGFADAKSNQVAFGPISATTNYISAETRDGQLVSQFKLAPTDPPVPAIQVQAQAAVTDPSGKLDGARVSAASAVAVGQQIRLTVTMFPGLPNLQPLTPVQIVGLPGHNGLYIVEETKIGFSPKAGLPTTHELAPMARPGSGGGKKKPAGAPGTPGNPRPGFTESQSNSVAFGSSSETTNYISAETRDGQLYSHFNEEMSQTIQGEVHSESVDMSMPEAPDGLDAVPDDAGGEL